VTPQFANLWSQLANKYAGQSKIMFGSSSLLLLPSPLPLPLSKLNFPFLPRLKAS
jgi:hypothetical protein